MSPKQKALVELLKASGPLSTNDLAAKLWPHWRTSRGFVPQAAEGTAFAMCRRLVAAGVLRQQPNTPNTAVFELVQARASA